MVEDARGGAPEESESRSCGSCSLCCTVLRVDELGKLGGTPCRHQRPAHPDGGCGIHARRPAVCRGYRCLWLTGSLDDEDRPDRLGAVLSLATEGATPTLFVHEAEVGSYDASPRLQRIADRFRESVPVRISAAQDVMNADRPYRVLLPGDVEHRVTGDRVVVYRAGIPAETRRLPWIERGLRRVVLALRRSYLRFVSKRGP